MRSAALTSLVDLPMQNIQLLSTLGIRAQDITSLTVSKTPQAHAVVERATYV